MPKENKLTVDAAVAILIQFSNYFCNNKLPDYSDSIWKQMSKRCENAWSAHNWWVNVKYNRREIYSLARHKMSLDMPDPSMNITIFTEGDKDESINFNNFSFDSTCENKDTWFDLILNSNEWEQIKPLKSGNKRSIYSLRPWIWTNVVADAFYRQYRLPCVYTFVRGNVHTSSQRKHYIKIIGSCKSKTCGNIFKGIVDTEPSASTSELWIRVKTRDTRSQTHEILQRPGEKRKRADKAAITEGCSNLRKRMVGKNLRLRDVDAPIIPSLDVLRHAKKEVIDEELDSKKIKGEDVIQAIYRLNFENPYKGSIAAISYLPLKVCYGTDEQISVYQQYHNMHKNVSSISIDITGSVVRKLKRSLDTKSVHIFLYVIAIHFDNMSLSVYQLLTESQETETIEHWLKMWLRMVKFRKPTQVVIDYSRAMLLACSKAFNDITIKKYIEICFNAVSAGEHVSREWISTYIRVDVAHIIHMVCRWPVLKSHPLRPVRDFYIRCIALMIDCQSYQAFVEIFSLTCIVALQYYQDSAVSVKLADQRIKTAEQSREKLESLIKEHPTDIDNYLQIIDSNNDQLNDDVYEVGDNNMKINEFFENIKTAAQSAIQEGKNNNIFYLPKLIDRLLKIAKEFPLWTGVCIPFYTSHPTTSYCERTFLDIKKDMFKNYSLPQGVDNFVKIHLRDLIECTRSFASKMQNFVMNENIPTWKPKDFRHYAMIRPIAETSPTELYEDVNIQYLKIEHDYIKSFDDSDLLSRENWHGKTEPLFLLNENQEKTEYILNDIIESNNGNFE